MSETNPVKFMLNQSNDAKESAVVDSNAFSLTKVLAAGAIIIGPIAAGVVDALQGLKSQHWVVLAIGLLGFLAITASADVIGRSIAAAAKNRADASIATAKSRADASIASIAGMTTFTQPLAGHRVTTGQDPAIEVLASGSGGYFLVKEDSSVKWLKEAEVRIP